MEMKALIMGLIVAGFAASDETDGWPNSGAKMLSQQVDESTRPESHDKNMDRFIKNVGQLADKIILECVGGQS